jgi:hypothetical protein
LPFPFPLPFGFPFFPALPVPFFEGEDCFFTAGLALRAGGLVFFLLFFFVGFGALPAS